MGHVVTATYRGLVPPWPVLGGPIQLTAQRRSFELGERSDGQISFNAAEIDRSWVRAGSAWSIESTLYDEVWLGFVDDEDWPMDSGELDIPLVGIIEGLLQVEAGTFESFTNAGSVIRAGLVLAAGRSTGVFPGTIEDGPLLDSTIGGDTVADLIEAVEDLSNLYSRERVEETREGLNLFLDFGLMEFAKPVVLTRNEIIDGIYKLGRVPVSVSVFGPGAGFAGRPVASVGSDTRPSLSGSGRGGSKDDRRGIQPIAPDINSDIRRRWIGPAAGWHRPIIEEQDVAIDGLAQRRLAQLHRGTEELAVTLDMTKPVVQSLHVGDMIRVRVADWAEGYGPLSLDNVHVHAIDPHEEDGTMDAILWPHPHG